jgi:hypothetical protein
MYVYKEVNLITDLKFLYQSKFINTGVSWAKHLHNRSLEIWKYILLYFL